MLTTAVPPAEPTRSDGIAAPGRTLPIIFTFTPLVPMPSSVNDSGGLKFTIVHVIRLYMPLTSTMDSTTVPLSIVFGSVERQTR